MTKIRVCFREEGNHYCTYDTLDIKGKHFDDIKYQDVRKMIPVGAYLKGYAPLKKMQIKIGSFWQCTRDKKLTMKVIDKLKSYRDTVEYVCKFQDDSKEVVYLTREDIEKVWRHIRWQ